MALLFNLGWNFTRLPSIRGVSFVMPINRFQQLFRCLHLVNNSAQIPHRQSGHDQLFKVHKLLDLFVQRFESEYGILQDCTIVEAMFPFKGRLCFKQYLKDKPSKWGIKVFVLALATNGTSSFQINSIGLCSNSCLAWRIVVFTSILTVIILHPPSTTIYIIMASMPVRQHVLTEWVFQRN